MTYKKKLIEVALPLEAINVASAREKSIRHGHPSTLHLWWARRPLAAARAVIFAQMVDDPSSHPDIFKTEKAQDKERQRLFHIIEELVKWESTTNETVLQQARDEIWQSWRYTCSENVDNLNAKELFDKNRLPAFHDPFAGGGALPLEAQRLGLESFASDLNPVAVTINKAMIEIPSRFNSMPPVNPKSRDNQAHSGSWKHAQGLAEDVRYYGQWMRDEADKRLGNLYPSVDISSDMVKKRPDLEKYSGQKLTVIAWLWAHTVRSPNPAFANIYVPLAGTFLLSSKAGRETYVIPQVGKDNYILDVQIGDLKEAAKAKNGTKLSRGSNFKCLMSGEPISGEYIKAEAKAGRMGSRLIAMVAEGKKGRVYLSPTAEQEDLSLRIEPKWKPDTPLEGKTRDQMPLYGMETFSDVFTNRQLVTLTTLSDLVAEAIEKIKDDARKTGSLDKGETLRSGGSGFDAYAEAIGVYLALGVDKATDYNTSLVVWSPTRDQAKSTFARQALPMVWDYAEVNPLARAAGDFIVSIEGAIRYLETACSSTPGYVTQANASLQTISLNKVISTDPPYYDNISYADLSDFFYVWLRRSLRHIFPELFATMSVPKAEELVATTARHGTKKKAETFFLDGMTQAMHRLAQQAHPAYPVTIYYAFKQSESGGDEGTTNTGWDTFLGAVIEAGFCISGTWPVRTERDARSIGIGTNALASSIVLVCRKRDPNSQVATRREFISELKTVLPPALAHLQAGNIAPVDLAQAAIGPGMAVYTRYAKVLDAEGKPLTVRAALALINQTLDEALAEQEGDFDADTRWALTWFDHVGFAEGDYGLAEQLSKSKNTAVTGLVDGGILLSKSGKVRLLKPAELSVDWDPTSDERLTVWEIVHQLVRVLEADGESAASVMVAKLGSNAETARELCYRLYTLCERKKRATEAMSYNGLVQSWPEITRLASEMPSAVKVGMTDMFEQE